PALDDFAVADLVQDLSGLLLAALVDPRALVRGEVAQHAAGDVRVHVEKKDRADEGVAAERDREPGKPGCWVEAALMAAAQEPDVLGRLLEDLVERGVVGSHRHALGRPARVDLLGRLEPRDEAHDRASRLRDDAEAERELVAGQEAELVLQAFWKG